MMSLPPKTRVEAFAEMRGPFQQLDTNAGACNPATGPESASGSAPPFTYEETTLDQWQAFVESHPNRTPFHSRQWIELFNEHYGFPLVVPVVRCGGEIVAATVFMKTPCLLGGSKYKSIPFTDYMPPLIENEEALRFLLAGFQQRRKTSVREISFRMESELEGYSNLLSFRRHQIALSPDMTDLLPKIPSVSRRNVRVAIKNGLTFETRTDWAATEDFFDLHVKTRKKLGVPVQPKRFFRHLHRKIIDQGLGYVAIARNGKKPIAGVILLRDNGILVCKYAASDPTELDNRPNDFLFFHTIQHAAEENRVFDFGVTHVRDEGLCRFKRKWLAVETNVYDVCIAGQMRGLGRNARGLNIASILIRNSPSLLCRSIGGLLYKYSV